MTFKRFLAVLGIGIGIMVLAMLWSIANMALASIQKALETSLHHLQWMMNCFGIFISAPILAMGKLGDMYGRKPFYQLGLVIMIVASIFAGLANHIGTLIACMAFFGLAGSMILPLSQALLIHQFPVKEKAKAVAIWAIFVSLSLAIGPIVGGMLIHYLGWRWIYWYNIPFAAIAFLIVTFFVERQKEFSKTVCDWVSVALLGFFIACFVLPTMQGAIWGWVSILTLGFYAASFLCGISLFIREKKVSAPLFRPELFLNRAFLFSAIPNGCTIGFLWIFFFIIPLYVQNVLGFSPLGTGTLFLLATIPLFLFSNMVAKGYDKIGAKPFLVIGYISFIVSFALLGTITPHGWSLYLVTLLIGFGWLMTWGPAISSALSTLPVKQAGIASGMLNTIQEVFAVAFLSVGGVFFHHAQRESLLPNLRVLKKAFEGKTHDQINSLISNPAAVQEEFGNTPIIPWLKKAFLTGFHEMFWFVLVAALFALFLSLLLPKYKNKSH